MSVISKIIGTHSERELKRHDKTVEKILSLNGGTVSSDGREFEVSMRAGYVRIPEGNLRYNTLFESFVIAGRNES